MKKILLGISLIFTFSSFAIGAAEEPVRILAAGRTSLTFLTSKKAELEKVAGTSVELNSQPTEIALVAVSKGMADGASTGLSFADAIRDTELKGKTKLNPADYQWLTLSKVEIKIALHPSNPTTSLTKEQVTDMVTGKTKSWESINGQKVPLKVIMAKQYDATEKSVSEYYLGGAKITAAEFVRDNHGLLNAMKANPGAIAFFTQVESLGDFTPKLIPTEMKRESVLTMKKPARPAAQKVFDYLKSQSGS